MATFEIKSGMTDQGPWILDLGTLMLDEGIELQRLTGFGPRQWIDALTEDDPLAVRFAFYLARKRSGEDVKFGDVTVNLFAMELSPIPEEGQEAKTADVPEEVAGVVPTGPVTSEPDQTSN